MISFDYTLQIDMGTKKTLHVPNEEIPTKLKNIFKIRGPNSSGKSTLMNIIAMAAHGNSNTNLPESIKTRIRDLNSAEYKELEFTIEMEDPVTKTRLKATKKKGIEIDVRESIDGKDFKIVTADAFVQKYNLIYDLPENPIGRLKELTNEIKSLQNEHSSNIEGFQSYIENVSRKAKGARDEAEIERAREKWKNLEAKLDELDREGLEKRGKIIEQLYYAMKVGESQTAFQQKEKSYKAFEDFKQSRKRCNSDADSKYDSEVRGINTKLVSLGITRNRICKNLESMLLEEIAKELRSYTFEKCINAGGVPNKFIADLSTVENEIEGLKTSSSDNMEVKLIEDLIMILDGYSNKNLSVLNYGAVDELKKRLESEHGRLTDKKIDAGLISEIKKDLRGIRGEVLDINTRISNLVKPKVLDVDQRGVREYERVETEFNDAKGKRTQILSEAKPHNVTLDNYTIIKQNSLKELGNEFSNKNINYVEIEMRRVKSASAHLKEEYAQLEKEVKEARREHEMLDSREDHKYRSRVGDLNKIQNELLGLRLSFNDAEKKIKAIVNKNYGAYGKDDPFFARVWNYLGKRIGFIQHLRDSYEVESINVIEDVVVTVDGTIIRMNDMGTGQTQLSYLMGLLSADDDRMIIALFDEVSTMDSRTMSKIIERFEELQKEGKLMIGMTVMPADEMEVEQFGL